MKPKLSELALIVEAAGGTVLQAAQGRLHSRRALLVVTTDEERKAWAPLAKQPHVTCIRAGTSSVASLRRSSSLAPRMSSCRKTLSCVLASWSKVLSGHNPTSYVRRSLALGAILSFSFGRVGDDRHSL